MSTAVASRPAKPRLSADSLAIGLSFMLVVTVAQRGIGFLRGIWLCRWLNDDVLGQWAMAFGFITLVSPMLLLGLVGTLPRYVETFRQQGHLRGYLKRVLGSAGALVVVVITAMLIVPDPFGWLIFRKSAAAEMVAAVAAAMLSMLAFNAVMDLVSGLRKVRLISWMQFVHSIGFTVTALSALALGGGLRSVIHSYALACVLGTMPGLVVLWRNWSEVPCSSEPFPGRQMWRRILPYATAIWTMNLLSNSFELSDRYMILHFSPSPDIGQALVGQYHSAMIIPALITSVALMASGVLLPYLTADWEAGKRAETGEKLKRILQSVSLLLTCVSAGALLVAPWLFSGLLGDRYMQGQAVLPLALLFSTWSALNVFANNYLWIAERGKLIGVSLLIGLFANIGLNYTLLPILGLLGAVLAAVLGNLIVTCGIWFAMGRAGYSLDQTSAWITLLPATIVAGPWAALTSAAVVLALQPDLIRQAQELWQSKKPWANR